MFGRATACLMLCLISSLCIIGMSLAPSAQATFNPQASCAYTNANLSSESNCMIYVGQNLTLGPFAVQLQNLTEYSDPVSNATEVLATFNIYYQGQAINSSVGVHAGTLDSFTASNQVLYLSYFNSTITSNSSTSFANVSLSAPPSRSLARSGLTRCPLP